MMKVYQAAGGGGEGGIPDMGGMGGGICGASGAGPTVDSLAIFAGPQVRNSMHERREDLREMRFAVGGR